jgi:hypothetical protein
MGFLNQFYTREMYRDGTSAVLCHIGDKFQVIVNKGFFRKQHTFDFDTQFQAEAFRETLKESCGGKC